MDFLRISFRFPPSSYTIIQDGTTLTISKRDLFTESKQLKEPGLKVFLAFQSAIVTGSSPETRDRRKFKYHSGEIVIYLGHSDNSKGTFLFQKCFSPSCHIGCKCLSRRAEIPKGDFKLSRGVAQGPFSVLRIGVCRREKGGKAIALYPPNTILFEVNIDGHITWVDQNYVISLIDPGAIRAVVQKEKAEGILQESFHLFGDIIDLENSSVLTRFAYKCKEYNLLGQLRIPHIGGTAWLRLSTEKRKLDFDKSAPREAKRIACDAHGEQSLASHQIPEQNSSINSVTAFDQNAPIDFTGTSYHQEMSDTYAPFLYHQQTWLPEQNEKQKQRPMRMTQTSDRVRKEHSKHVNNSAIIPDTDYSSTENSNYPENARFPIRQDERNYYLNDDFEHTPQNHPQYYGQHYNQYYLPTLQDANEISDGFQYSQQNSSIFPHRNINDQEQIGVFQPPFDASTMYITETQNQYEGEDTYGTFDFTNDFIPNQQNFIEFNSEYDQSLNDFL